MGRQDDDLTKWNDSVRFDLTLDRVKHPISKVACHNVGNIWNLIHTINDNSTCTSTTSCIRSVSSNSNITITITISSTSTNINSSSTSSIKNDKI